MHDLTLTLIQTSLHWEDKQANLAHFERLISGAAPADIIVLPEMFNTGFITRPEHLAEEMDGPTVAWLVSMARETKKAICGSLIIRANGKYYNRFIFAGPDGEFHTYDKRHLFTMAGEHLHFSRSEERTIFSYRGWNILPLICYDLRFPVWSKNTYRDGRTAYDLMLVVANWPEVRSHAWKTFLPARAMENMAFVAAVNRVGEDGRGVPHSGDSGVYDPNGHPIAACPPHEEHLITVTLAAKALKEVREKFNIGPDWDEHQIAD